MMDQAASVSTNVMTPVIQYGFAGLSVVLLGILVWLIREVLKILEKTSGVIAGNTQAIQAVDHNAKETLRVAIEVKDELNKRPCIARFKQAPE